MDTPQDSSKDFAAWYGRLDAEQRAAYAAKADTSTNYIESHLLAPYKIPRADAMKRLADGTGGEFTVAQLAAWFYESTLARKSRQAERGGHAAP